MAFAVLKKGSIWNLNFQLNTKFSQVCFLPINNLFGSANQKNPSDLISAQQDYIFSLHVVKKVKCSFKSLYSDHYMTDVHSSVKKTLLSHTFLTKTFLEFSGREKYPKTRESVKILCVCCQNWRTNSIVKILQQCAKHVQS